MLLSPLIDTTESPQHGKIAHFALIEVGIRPTGKRSQLRKKLEMLRRSWARHHKDIPQIGQPEVYKFLARYRQPLDMKRFHVDAVIQYTRITEEMLQLDDVHKYELVRSTHTKHARRVLGKVLIDNDHEGLHYLISHGHRRPGLTSLRGRFAETLVLNDIERFKPEGSRFTPNVSHG